MARLEGAARRQTPDVRYPLAIEWALEWFYYRLRSLALFDLLELAGRCTVLVIAIFWLLESDDRTKERHYRAWELINSARGSTGDGGRKDALQDLNRDGVSLAGAPLEKAYLHGIDLESASLAKANLEGADLQEANLTTADLRGASLEGANLYEANLEGAYLNEANLKIADLRGASLERAQLAGANLDGADLTQADLRRANLEGTIVVLLEGMGAVTPKAPEGTVELDRFNLVGAILAGANFGGAILAGARLGGANLAGVDLREAKDLTQEQVDAAIGDERTQLPEGLTRPAHWLKTGDEGPPAAKE